MHWTLKLIDIFNLRYFHCNKIIYAHYQKSVEKISSLLHNEWIIGYVLFTYNQANNQHVGTILQVKKLISYVYYRGYDRGSVYTGLS